MFTAVKWSQFKDSIGNSCQAQGFLYFQYYEQWNLIRFRTAKKTTLTRSAEN